MQSKNHRGNTPLAKPEGGYVSISTVSIGLLWWSLSEGLITSWAVRVGLALFELRIRRAAFIWTEKKAGRGAPEFVPNYSAGELASLCGLPLKRVNTALRELLKLGILAEFSPETIRFARSLSEVQLSPEQRSSFRSWLESLTKRRTIPIPRRVLVLACESSSRALIAVILAACLRCSWLRPGEGFSFTGRISCEWIAKRFRLSLRAVQGAKEHLVGLGWLERKGNINRLGEVVAINPAWHRLVSLPEVEKSQAQGAGGPPATTPAGTNSAGVERPAGTNSAGISFIPESSPIGEIQTPGRKSPGAVAPENPGPGVFNQEPKREPKNQDRPASTLPPPRLSSIRPEDLRSTERLLGKGGLFGQAVKAKLLTDCEADQLYFIACAERARTVEVRNPCGVFNTLMKNRKKFGAFVSAEQEDSARRRIRDWRNSRCSNAVPFLMPRGLGPIEPLEPRRERLSKDAELVKVLRQQLKGQESVFAALHNHAGWDRDRYARALAELEAAGNQPAVAVAR